jgi:hypothetical protein
MDPKPRLGMCNQSRITRHHSCGSRKPILRPEADPCQSRRSHGSEVRTLILSSKLGWEQNADSPEPALSLSMGSPPQPGSYLGPTERASGTPVSRPSAASSKLAVSEVEGDLLFVPPQQVVRLRRMTKSRRPLLTTKRCELKASRSSAPAPA